MITFRDIRLLIRDLFFPYNKLKIRNISWRYTETDDILFHATFTVFCKFFEQEYMYASNAGEHNINQAIKDYITSGYHADTIKFEVASLENHNMVDRTIIELYTWYTKIRPIRDKLLEQDYSYAQYELNEQENNLMLIKLISVRRCLWT